MEKPTDKEAPKKTVREIEAERNAKVNIDQEVPLKRRRFLIVNPTEFLSLFTKGFVFGKRTKILTGVPNDAIVVNMTVDHVRGGIVLVIESEEYEEVPMTDMPPVQLIEIQIGVENATKKKKK